MNERERSGRLFFIGILTIIIAAAMMEFIPDHWLFSILSLFVFVFGFGLILLSDYILNQNPESRRVEG